MPGSFWRVGARRHRSARRRHFGSTRGCSAGENSPSAHQGSATHALACSSLCKLSGYARTRRLQRTAETGIVQTFPKSQIAQQVAVDASREYVDVRALLLDPVDLRGIPWRDSADRTRWRRRTTQAAGSSNWRSSLPVLFISFSRGIPRWLGRIVPVTVFPG